MDSSHAVFITGLGWNTGWNTVLCGLKVWPNAMSVMVVIGVLMSPSPTSRKLSTERLHLFGESKEREKQFQTGNTGNSPGSYPETPRNTKAVPVWVYKGHSITGFGVPTNADIAAVTKNLDCNTQVFLNTWKIFPRRINKSRLWRLQ